MPLSLDDPALLLRPDVIADPRPLYDLLRREAPVWQVPGQDTFLVADPDLIREAVARPDDFSSNLVSVVRADERRCPVAVDLVPFGDPIHVLATADPPVHTAHRKLLQRHLSPRAVASLEADVRDIVDRQLAPLLDAGRGDVVAHVGNPVPAMAICRVIGVPTHDAEALVPAVLATGELLDGVTDAAGMARAGIAAIELMGYARSSLDAARSLPPGERTGLLAVLLDGIDAQVVTADQARDILVQLFSAGTETTSSLIATTIERIAGDALLQRELRGHPERIPAAVEAILADDGPFQFHYRYAVADTSLGGTTIPGHSRVLLLWAAGNRPGPSPTDDGTIGAADGDVSRPPSHLAFGRGLHFCIGAPLARLEVRVVIEQLLAQTSSVTLDGAQASSRRASVFLRRHESLPVIVTAAGVT